VPSKIEDFGVAEPLGKQLLALSVLSGRSELHSRSIIFMIRNQRTPCSSRLLWIGIPIGHPGGSPDQKVPLPIPAQFFQWSLPLRGVYAARSPWADPR